MMTRPSDRTAEAFCHRGNASEATRLNRLETVLYMSMDADVVGDEGGGKSPCKKTRPSCSNCI